MGLLVLGRKSDRLRLTNPKWKVMEMVKAKYNLTVVQKGKLTKPYAMTGVVTGAVLDSLPGKAFRQAREAIKRKKMSIYDWETLTLTLTKI